MRKIYLIRHGKPDFPQGEKYCIGITDTPLSVLGRLQGVLLGAELEGKTSAVFSSPLNRAIGTARGICSSVQIIDELIEMNAGDWDGLSFREIRTRWPEIFAARGIEPSTPIPGSENVNHGQIRFASAVENALRTSNGDIAIVAHATVNQSLVCKALCLPLSELRNLCMEYGSYTVLEYDGDYHISSESNIGVLPHPALTESVCRKLLKAAECPENVIAHSVAVCGVALEVAKELEKNGIKADTKLVKSAALLHDIARTLPEHPAVGAGWLKELGYPDVAEIIRQHHIPDNTGINEASIVYIADKLVHGTDRVTLSQRFNMSLKKCRDVQAVKAHSEKEHTAIEIKDKINKICDKELIQ